MAGLSFYMHDGPKTFRFELNGGLAGVEASRLAQAWRTASSTIDGKILCVDVTHLTFADRERPRSPRPLAPVWSAFRCKFGCIARFDGVDHGSTVRDTCSACRTRV